MQVLQELSAGLFSLSIDILFIFFFLELRQVWRISFERFLHFLKSSQALSPGVALETAAVLQVLFFTSGHGLLFVKVLNC
jgi:hypothetical protein